MKDSERPILIIKMNTDNKKQFNIIDSTPLVSVDLIIKNPNKEILLGKRVNRPAQGYWFVPGGRILKNEKILDALKRVSKTEIGYDLSNHNPKLLGAYDHICRQNIFLYFLCAHCLCCKLRVVPSGTG